MNVRPRTGRILVGCGAGAALLAGYSNLLLLAGRRSRREDRRAAGSPPTLAFLVPAHDEEATIAPTLEALAAVDYPGDRLRTLVIADNCTDRTAALARSLGAAVLEREDSDRRGKGYALALGISTLLADSAPPDAVVVIDADCRVTPDLPTSLARELESGARAVQAPYVVANPCASRYSALRYAAFTAVNRARPLGRTRLGLSAGLLGTGMAFSRELLTERPWNAFGLAEDAEYHLSLVEAGERVVFAAGGAVESAMPTTFETASSQQARWEGGRWALIRGRLPGLLRGALRRRDPVAAGAALDLLTPPLSMTVGGSGLVLAAAVLARNRPAARLAALALIGQTVYVGGSVRQAGAPACVYRALLSAPLLFLWELKVVGRVLGRRGPDQWVRTTRDGAAK
jgi:Glycosyltransferase like family 2